MLSTPDLGHLTKQDFRHVYEPAEDTFLLLDALEEDIEQLHNLKPQICLEIGLRMCIEFLGSITSALVNLSAVDEFTLTSELNKLPPVLLCTDINSHACRCTYDTGVHNKTILDPVLTSLASPLITRLAGQVDVLLFNPPYVPTWDEEAGDAQLAHGIESAWAGGIDGMQVTDQLLSIVTHLLSPCGIFYLLALKQNNIPEIQRRMSQEFNLESQVALQRRAGREHLYILKFYRSSLERVTTN